MQDNFFSSKVFSKIYLFETFQPKVTPKNPNCHWTFFWISRAAKNNTQHYSYGCLKITIDSINLYVANFVRTMWWGIHSSSISPSYFCRHQKHSWLTCLYLNLVTLNCSIVRFALCIPASLIHSGFLKSFIILNVFGDLRIFLLQLKLNRKMLNQIVQSLW